LNKTAILFPGQGAQVVGMGKDVAQASGPAREVFERADHALGFKLSAVCFDGPAERLNATNVSQPAIFVTSVAIWRALEAHGIAEELAPQAMAGLSLGEYTALHLAGWIGFEDCLKLVAERGRLMQAAAEASPGGMVSMIGLSEADTARMCKEAAQGDVLGAANFNCQGQIVVSGSKAACARAMALADKYAAKAVPLTVAGAFHSPLMEAAASGLKTALQAAEIRIGRIGVVSNVSADYHAHPGSVRSLLQEQVTKPVRWQASIERLIGEGFDRFAEVGPGRVLTGLMRKIDRAVATMNFSTAASLERVPT
jgi:[acyl-carrier-protein] S-malonyltransferase